MNKDARLIRLKTALLEIAPGGVLAVAFSGGLDSRFLSFAARELGFDVKLLNICGPHIAKTETTDACAWAQKEGFEIRSVYLDPLEIQEVSENHPDRCYYCKKQLFSLLLEETKGLPLCDGTNHSDLAHYRPGLKALNELGIRSPLAEARLTKQDNRELGALLGLDNCEQVALPCMLTRVPYNEKVNPGELIALAEAETALAEFFGALGKGTIRFRLRKISSGTFELHIFKDDFARLSPSEIENGKKILEQYPSVRPSSWRSCEKLSGYFDRKANL